MSFSAYKFFTQRVMIKIHHQMPTNAYTMQFFVIPYSAKLNPSSTIQNSENMVK